MKFKIEGADYPIATCRLESGESLVAKRGGVSWYSSNVKIKTDSDGFKKSVVKIIAGENPFQNTYSVHSAEGTVALTLSSAGKIIALELDEGDCYYCRTGSFLACTPDIKMTVVRSESLVKGILSGDGAFLEKIKGKGTVFIKTEGACTEYDLEKNQKLVFNDSYIVAVSGSCKTKIKFVKGFKHFIIGGESPCKITVEGEGKVVVQAVTHS